MPLSKLVVALLTDTQLRPRARNIRLSNSLSVTYTVVSNSFMVSMPYSNSAVALPLRCLNFFSLLVGLSARNLHVRRIRDCNGRANAGVVNQPKPCVNSRAFVNATASKVHHYVRVYFKPFKLVR